MGYAVVYPKTRTGYNAHVPDLPSCIAAATTSAQMRRLMREAIALHIGGLEEDGIRIPRPARPGQKSATVAHPPNPC